MDVLCERCGEPWEADYVQHEMTRTERDLFWRGAGCPSCYGKEPCREDCERCPTRDEYGCCTAGKFRARADSARQAQAAIRSVLGDDLDGLAAEMEDLGLT